MTPDLNKAARAAADVFSSSCRPDPLHVLQSMPNVLLISFESSAGLLSGQDSLTLVDRKGDHLHYIVLYNAALPVYRLQRALARELGHVALRHDGSAPEYVWTEEADCFAFHFLCMRPAVTIYFRPHHASVSWSFKDMQEFSSLQELKEVIAEQRTRYSRFIGRNVSYTPDDVHISALEKDHFGNWKNYSLVAIDNQTIGYCGE